jgi:nitric oxide reductase subunit B
MEISPWWRHGAVIVIIVGITGLMFMGRQVYQGAPPIFEKVVNEQGQTLFTGEDILAGQGVFQKYGLMDYGTVFGHGGYRGPDFTADYLHRTGVSMQQTYSQQLAQSSYATLSPDQKSIIDQKVVQDLKRNRYDKTSRVLTLSKASEEAYEKLKTHYQELFLEGDEKTSLPKGYISNSEESLQLSRFFFWSAWAAVTPRPGKEYTYTNNWPPDDVVGNRPSTAVFIWSALSLISLFGALGLVLMFFGRFDYLGWGGGKITEASFPDIVQTPLVASQKATYKFFAVVSLLFLFQTLILFLKN